VAGAHGSRVRRDRSEVDAEVRTIEPGQFVIGSFFACDNTCEICEADYQSSCIQRQPVGAEGAHAELLRVPLADGTLVATPALPAEDVVPSLLAAFDVLGTGWFGAVAAEVRPPGQDGWGGRGRCRRSPRRRRAYSPPSRSADPSAVDVDRTPNSPLPTP
jgi:hypothetical protein